MSLSTAPLPSVPPQGSDVRRAARTGALPGMPARKSRKLWPLVALAAVVLAGGGLGAMLLLRGAGDGSQTILTYTVRPETFDVRIPLSGELKAMRNVEIRNQVEGQTTIMSLIPEGSKVKEGDILVTLASDAIKDRLDDAKIRVENALAATVNSQESLTIQQMQNESDIKAAETNEKLAQMEFDQFDKGDDKVQRDTLITTLENAETDLKRKTQDRERVEVLAKRGFVSDNDVLDAKIAERDALNKRDSAKSGLEVFDKYAEPRQRTTLELKRSESLAEFERVKRKATAAILLKQADLRAKQQTQHVEERRTKQLQDQFDACTIRAPQPGMVVYQSSIQQGNQSQGLIEEGAQVRQNQTLIQLPDTSKMLVEVRLAEQLIERVKPGQEAVISVDALPGRFLHGRVEDIAVLPDSSNRWMNPNLKEYPTRILLDEAPGGLKPGMSAKVEIQVSHFSEIIAPPVQAVFYGGGKSYVYVGTPEKYVKRFVKTGASSSTRVEILDGLTLNDTLLLSRPKDAPEDPAATESQPEGRGKKKRDGGAATQTAGGGPAPMGSTAQ